MGTRQVTAVHLRGPVSYDLRPWLECAQKDVPQTNADIAMTTMVRGNSHLLPEWIEYHRMLGVNHFWIYANEPLEKFREKIDWYLPQEYITVIPLDKHITNTGFRWVDWFFQSAQQNDCLQRARRANTSWLILNDVDEFVHVTSKNQSLVEMLFQQQRQPNGGGPLYLWNWYYGKQSRAAPERQSNATFGRYVYRNHNATNPNFHGGKSMVQPQQVVHYFVHHVSVSNTKDTGRQPDPRAEMHMAHFKESFNGVKEDKDPELYTSLSDKYNSLLSERLDYIRMKG